MVFQHLYSAIGEAIVTTKLSGSHNPITNNNKCIYQMYHSVIYEIIHRAITYSTAIQLGTSEFCGKKLQSACMTYKLYVPFLRILRTTVCDTGVQSRVSWLVGPLKLRVTIQLTHYTHHQANLMVCVVCSCCATSPYR